MENMKLFKPSFSTCHFIFSPQIVAEKSSKKKIAETCEVKLTRIEDKSTNTQISRRCCCIIYYSFEFPLKTVTEVNFGMLTKLQNKIQ